MAERPELYTCYACSINAKDVTSWYMVLHAGTKAIYCSLECLFNATGEAVINGKSSSTSETN